LMLCYNFPTIMTLFGKMLALALLALASGAAWIIVENWNNEQPITNSQQFATSSYTSVLPPSSVGATENTAIATSTKKEKGASTEKIATTTTPIVTAPVPQLPTINYSIPNPPPDWNKINAYTRSALANILCTAKDGDQFRPLSGSGVFIDPRGIILTNAHVAQYLLLTGGGEKSDLLDCVIRIGNPAATRYKADILYISPKWVQKHAKYLLEENQKESGENDYALLLITGTTNPNGSLPDSFPFIPLSKKILSDSGRQDGYLVAGYPAGFLGGIAVQRELWSVSSFATITKRYTFSENTVDIIGLGGNILAQKGSSGGAFVDGNGELAGLIVTAILEGDTAERDVRALTTNYINRAFSEEAGFSLFEIENFILPPLLSQFQNDFLPSMRQQLVEVIRK